MNVRSLNREKYFGLGIIHDDTFNVRKIICTPIDELGAMGGLVEREKMGKGFKNTTGISALVLKGFQFIFSRFNCFV